MISGIVAIQMWHKNDNQILETSADTKTQTSAPVEDESISYDEQIKAIFKSASEGGGGFTIITDAIDKDGLRKPVNTNEAEFEEKKHAIDAIYQKLNNNEMLLKNIVFRKDTSIIRITYADKNNDYVFKVAYKTDHDPVLVNSLYADKPQLIDIKIMYRKKDNDNYEYILLQNDIQHQLNVYEANKAKLSQISNGMPALQRPTLSVSTGIYHLTPDLGNERCGYCHILAKNDSPSNNGLFFTRYQETSKEAQKEFDAKSVFREADFTRTTKDALSGLNLPENMTDDFLFSSISPEKNNIVQSNHYARVLFEMPELVEVLSRDNQQSYCINVNFGKDNSAFSNDNYVCADYQNKKLYVRYQNEYLTTQKGEVNTVIPFY